METTILRAIPVLPALLLYWSVIAVAFVVQARRRARREIAHRAQRAGEDFEIALSIPLGGFIAAAALPIVVLLLAMVVT